MKETKSNWQCVADYMQKKNKNIELGKYASYWFHKSPRRMLHYISYYKFAAKMIGNDKKVLDVGCNEGLGTYLFAKECSFAKGLDFDEEAIKIANKNFSDFKNVEFSCCDFFDYKGKNEFDAAVSFDVIEHILPKNASSFIEKMSLSIKENGLIIIGTPSMISQDFASKISKKGHVNIYSPDRLEQEMRKHFEFVFMFAANDEVIHTGFLPLAHYLITIGCKKLNG